MKDKLKRILVFVKVSFRVSLVDYIIRNVSLYFCTELDIYY
jgi:hypothetical protein